MADRPITREQQLAAIKQREGAPADRSHGFEAAMPHPCAAWWMAEALPADAISIKDQMPPQWKHVLGFVSAPDVAIHHTPVVIWWTDKLDNGEIVWWAGLPGSYLSLRRWNWTVTHWLLLPTRSSFIAAE